MEPIGGDHFLFRRSKLTHTLQSIIMIWCLLISEFDIHNLWHWWVDIGVVTTEVHHRKANMSLSPSIMFPQVTSPWVWLNFLSTSHSVMLCATCRKGPPVMFVGLTSATNIHHKSDSLPSFLSIISSIILMTFKLPSGYFNIAMENGPLIVDFPS